MAAGQDREAVHQAAATAHPRDDHHPKRFRPTLNSIIARLEDELQAQQHRLEQEITENKRVKATDGVLRALAAAQRALQRGLLEGAAAPSDLQEVDRCCAEFVAQINPSLQADAHAANLSEGVTRWRYGALQLPPSEFICRALAAKGVEMDRDTFVAHHKECVMELAMLLAHAEAGEAVQPRLQELITEISVSVTGNFLTKPWGPSILALDAATGSTGEAPMDKWRRVARAQNPSDAALLFMSIIHRWWNTTAEVLTAERQALAAEALSAPDDVDLQDEVNQALGRVNMLYLLSATASGVLWSTTFSSPLGAARLWVQLWPRFPLLTAMVVAYEELSAERAAARSKGTLQSGRSDSVAATTAAAAATSLGGSGSQE